MAAKNTGPGIPGALGHDWEVVDIGTMPQPYTYDANITTDTYGKLCTCRVCGYVVVASEYRMPADAPDQIESCHGDEAVRSLKAASFMVPKVRTTRGGLVVLDVQLILSGHVISLECRGHRHPDLRKVVEETFPGPYTRTMNREVARLLGVLHGLVVSHPSFPEMVETDQRRLARGRLKNAVKKMVGEAKRAEVRYDELVEQVRLVWDKEGVREVMDA